jgi:inner membrane protein
VDNLTHALAGMLAAEAVVQLRAEARTSALSTPGSSRNQARPWRSVAYVVSVAGNNLPDLDFLWSGVTVRPFGYLLHHRGHSHTLPGALVATVLLIGAVMAVTRRAGWSRADHCWIFALCLFGPLTHIAMDGSNNYGTHPFWPFYGGWMYGDAVFIVEPFFFAAGFPPLIFAAHSAITRLTLLALMVLGIGAAFYVPFVPAPMAVAVVLAALLCFAATWRATPRVRALVGIGASLTVAALFFAASRRAAALVKEALPGDRVVLDVVVTPLPANPLCLTVLTVERSRDYVARRATVATWPALYGPERCPDLEELPTAPFSPSTAHDTPHVRWRGEFVAPLAELVALERSNCQAAALLRFLRVPFWVEGDDGTLVLGDLRYDRSPGLDFSDARIEQRPSSCPTAVPGWLPPRRDLLRGE